MTGCTQLCNQGRDCTCTEQVCLIDIRAAKVAPIKTSKPVEPYVNPMSAVPVGDDTVVLLSGREMALVWGCMLAFGISSLVLIGSAAGYLWARWLA